MAKFESRHSRKKHSLFSGPLRLLMLIALLVVLVLYFLPDILNRIGTIDGPGVVGGGEGFYLPAETRYPIYHKKHYTLAYAEEYEQAAWVAYELTVDQLNAKKVGRSDYFKDDFTIKSGSAQFADYKKSGYTKGHLVPAADRAYSIEAMEETFLMSNMTPQIYHCNGAIWRELEEQVRDWARANRALYITAGPVFSQQMKRIGRNKVAVPNAYFKAVVDLTDPEFKAIAFIIPNELSEEPLQEYSMTIDALEEQIGLDLFHELMTEELEEELESNLNLSDWKFDKKRFQQRIDKWNN